MRGCGTAICSSPGTNPTDAARAAELDQLVDAGDWDGLIAAAAKFEASAATNSAASGIRSLITDKEIDAVYRILRKPGHVTQTTWNRRFREFKEKLIHFDREAMTYEYVGTEGMPWFVTGAQNRWSVIANGEAKSVVKSHAQLHLKWWLRPLAPVLRLLIA